MPTKVNKFPAMEKAKNLAVFVESKTFSDGGLGWRPVVVLVEMEVVEVLLLLDIHCSLKEVDIGTIESQPFQ